MPVREVLRGIDQPMLGGAGMVAPVPPAGLAVRALPMERGDAGINVVEMPRAEVQPLAGRGNVVEVAALRHGANRLRPPQPAPLPVLRLPAAAQPRRAVAAAAAAGQLVAVGGERAAERINGVGGAPGDGAGAGNGADARVEAFRIVSITPWGVGNYEPIRLPRDPWVTIRFNKEIELSPAPEGDGTEPNRVQFLFPKHWLRPGQPVSGVFNMMRISENFLNVPGTVSDYRDAQGRLIRNGQVRFPLNNPGPYGWLRLAITARARLNGGRPEVIFTDHNEYQWA
ncbi:MAG: hypothetical protein AB7K09_11115 [Planctomycetota bacterium]